MTVPALGPVPALVLPAPAPPVRIRYGAAADVDRVVALHARCSEESRYRRYHAPLPRLGARLARQLLCPDGGWSLVAELDVSDRSDFVAMACAGPLSSTDLEIGLLVEDAVQGLGIGTRLLRDLVTDAGARGYRQVHCLTQPDNHAVLTTVERAGLAAATGVTDGLLHLLIALPGAP